MGFAKEAASLAGALSLRFFLFNLVSATGPSVVLLLTGYVEDITLSLTICSMLFFSVLAIVSTYISSKYDDVQLRQVARYSSGLGLLFGAGILVSLGGSVWQPFGWYLCVLAFFHFSEFYCTSIYNPKSLSLDSFLINHSRAYHLAAVSSWIEFTLELMLLPGLKQLKLISVCGLVLAMFGELLRKAAMFTAGTNFNHLIQCSRDSEHVLVTNGVYSWSRHPSYVGWFYWSMATQVILCNPICFVAYTLASWNFFNERIEDEEYTLLEFFGEDYENYKRQVGTKLPFIDGIKLNTE